MRIGPILALLLLPACADELGPDAVDADAGSDTDVDGSAPASDASIGGGSDAGAPNDGGPAGADAETPPSLTEDFDSDGCFNGLDDDLNELTDCEESACSATPYCCVGSASAGCCVGPGARIDADFATCGGSDPRACAGGAPFTWFGSPQPALESGAFVPNGDAIHDSGLVLGAPLDPTRERVELSATMAASVDGCADCLDVLALGLADAPAPNARVVPDVAVMVRASRRDYALMIAGDVVGSAPLVDSMEHLYALEVSPDGGVVLRVDGAVEMASNALLRPNLVPLLYGRTHNRDGLRAPARARDVHAASFGCDIPSALARDASAVIPFAGVTWGARVAMSPSVAVDGVDRLVAFALDRDVHLARRQGDGSWTLAGGGRVEAPVLTAGVNETLRDPELVREADRWVIYATRHPADGEPRVALALGGDGFEERFDALTDVVLPADAGATEAPAVVDDGGVRWMAVRITHEGTPAIALLRATDGGGTTFTWAGADRASSIVVTPSADFTRFDHDDVSDPDLLVDDGGLLRLFYGGRRGTRWSIGVVVSGDRSTWREPPGAPVLAGSGAGHDSLWARHPSAVLAAERLELFYTGSDGVGLDIGRAEGMAP